LLSLFFPQRKICTRNGAQKVTSMCMTCVTV
jgi:hypothetical protein